jgi:hypothetical protein
MPTATRHAIRPTLLAAAAVAVAALLAGCGGSPAPVGVLHFHSRPDLTPPAVDVLANTGGQAPGYVFISPKKGAPQKGPEILDDSGQPVWWGPVAQQATDFRVQEYRGKPVLTYWEGPPTAPVVGTGVGHGVILDSHYRQIARVDSGFGPDTSDLHEFQLTPQGTALITVDRIVDADLTSVQGAKDGKAVDGIVQEIDVATGKVLFTWHSIGHVAFSESYSPHPAATGDDAQKPWDYFHINSIQPLADGNLLISARNTHAVYEIDTSTGDVVWRLGGKRSTFAMGPGTRFAWQHDARMQPDGTITIFDDEAAPAVGKHSRAIRLRIDLGAKTATLVHADIAPDGILTGSQGSAQVLANGDLFVGWGAIPRFTEYAPSGRIVYDASFPEADDSYRAFRFAWTGEPDTRPAIAVAPGGVYHATVYASWNGATEVASWRVLAGPSADELEPVGSAPRHGFETTLEPKTQAAYYAVQALDANGTVLGTSAAVQRGGLAIG